MLYQLSYAHHATRPLTTSKGLEEPEREEVYLLAPDAPNRAQAPAAWSVPAPVIEPPCSSASAFAVSESGPGWGTNTAER